MSKLPKWFNGEVYDKGDTVTNPFSGDSYKLDNKELSMYDFIIGAQLVIESTGGIFSGNTTEIQEDMGKGLYWFRRCNPKAYIVLLD